MGLIVQSNFFRDLPPPPPPPVETAELHAIAQYVRQGRCALFVGAGLSAGAGLPTWEALMKRLVNRLTGWAISEGVVPNEIMMVEDDRYAENNPISRAVRKELGELRYNQLLKAIRRKSSLTSLPQIVAFALEIIGRESIERAELLRLLNQKRFPELAEFCKERLGARQFEKQVRRALVPKRGLLPSRRHIVRTPFSCVMLTATGYGDLRIVG